MATGIIIGIITALCIIALKSYLKKLAHGCCGAGGDSEKSSANKDISDCKYKYVVHIGGMTCKNCAARIENAFERQKITALADFKKGIAEIYSRSPVSEFTLRQTIVGLGYSVERTEENEL